MTRVSYNPTDAFIHFMPITMKIQAEYSIQKTIKMPFISFATCAIILGPDKFTKNYSIPRTQSLASKPDIWRSEEVP